MYPGESSEEKNKQLYGQEWYAEFKADESRYYSALEKKFGKREDPYKYPQESPEVVKLQSEYYSLPENDGPRGGDKSKSLYIDAHPELVAYWDMRREAQNRHREALGLSPKENPSKDFAKSVGGFAKGSGGSSSAKGNRKADGPTYDKRYISQLLGSGKTPTFGVPNISMASQTPTFKVSLPKKSPAKKKVVYKS